LSDLEASLPLDSRPPLVGRSRVGLAAPADRRVHGSESPLAMLGRAWNIAGMTEPIIRHLREPIG
jgi:hypothetical protein